MADLIGIPWRLYGRDPRTGVDCTGLLILCFRRIGIEIQDPLDCGEDRGEDFISLSDKLFAETHAPADVLGFSVENNAGFVDHYGFSIGAGFMLHTRKGGGSLVEGFQKYQIRLIEVTRHKKCLR